MCQDFVLDCVAFRRGGAVLLRNIAAHSAGVAETGRWSPGEVQEVQQLLMMGGATI